MNWTDNRGVGGESIARLKDMMMCLSFTHDTCTADYFIIAVDLKYHELNKYYLN